MKSITRSLRVLVVDDDEKILRLIQLFLRQQGYSVDTALQGREGLRLMLAHSYDLLIVDIQMPVMDGIAFSAELRAIWPWQDIIFCTGFLNDTVRQKARELGIKHILEKPLSLNTLQTVIEQTLRQWVTAPSTFPLCESCPGPFEMGLLRRFSLSTYTHLHVGKALQEFASLVYDLIDCRAVAVVGQEEDMTHVQIVTRGTLPSDEIADLSGECLKHFSLLADAPPPESLTPKVRVAEISSPEGTSDGCHYRHVPVTGKTKLLGWITISLRGTHAASLEKFPLVLMAAQHLSTLLQALEVLEICGMHDPLTGLFSRRYLDETLERITNIGDKNTEQSGLLVIDIDHFRAINERYGVDAGDQVLREIGHLLLEYSLKNEFAVRSGSDEFLLYAARATPARLLELATQILKRLNENGVSFGSQKIPVTATVAYALSGTPHSGNLLPQLLECAHHSIDAAKAEGGNKVCSWTEQAEQGHGLPLHPVLVVDDDPQVQHLVRRILNPAMYEITAAKSVAEGMALLVHGSRFEVLLTDLALPNEDGIDMLRGSLLIDPDMVRVVISGNISKNTEDQLRNQGAFDVIQKPFHPVAFRNHVAKAIEFRQRSRRKARKE
jgi:diguanylate cyclase (GGDEF)-like protein